MVTDYRQEVIRKLAVYVNPNANFKISNSILIPEDEDSIKAMLVANSILDHLRDIFGFNAANMSGIYECVFNRYKEASDVNLAKFLDLLKVIGLNQAETK